MIERIVLFKLRGEHAQRSARAEIAAHTRRVFATLPGVRGFSVGEPADEWADKAWDLSIIVRFDSLEDVAAYAADPTHREYVDVYLKDRVEVRKAWNFEIE